MMLCDSVLRWLGYPIPMDCGCVKIGPNPGGNVSKDDFSEFRQQLGIQDDVIRRAQRPGVAQELDETARFPDRAVGVRIPSLPLRCRRRRIEISVAVVTKEYWDGLHAFYRLEKEQIALAKDTITFNASQGGLEGLSSMIQALDDHMNRVKRSLDEDTQDECETTSVCIKNLMIVSHGGPAGPRSGGTPSFLSDDILEQAKREKPQRMERAGRLWPEEAALHDLANMLCDPARVLFEGCTIGQNAALIDSLAALISRISGGAVSVAGPWGLSIPGSGLLERPDENGKKKYIYQPWPVLTPGDFGVPRPLRGEDLNIAVADNGNVTHPADRMRRS